MKHVSQVMNKTIPSMTFLNKMTCECSEEVSVYEMVIPLGPRKGEKIEAKMGCKCEDIELVKKTMQSHKQMQTRKVKDLFNRHSLINKELQNASLVNYQPENESQEKAKRIAERYVEIFEPEKARNLLFYGTYGIGKSHLAKGISDEVIKLGYSSIFISIPKLLTRFRSSYNKNSDYSEGDLIEALNTTDLLVLDDLGSEKKSDWTLEMLFNIIDSRQGMHTIYTANYNPEDLIDRLGERNFSRVVNRDTTLVEIQGNNYRLKNFAKGGNS